MVVKEEGKVFRMEAKDLDKNHDSYIDAFIAKKDHVINCNEHHYVIKKGELTKKIPMLFKGQLLIERII